MSRDLRLSLTASSSNPGFGLEASRHVQSSRNSNSYQYGGARTPTYEQQPYVAQKSVQKPPQLNQPAPTLKPLAQQQRQQQPSAATERTNAARQQPQQRPQVEKSNVNSQRTCDRPDVCIINRLLKRRRNSNNTSRQDIHSFSSFIKIPENLINRTDLRNCNNFGADIHPWRAAKIGGIYSGSGLRSAEDL